MYRGINNDLQIDARVRFGNRVTNYVFIPTTRDDRIIQQSVSHISLVLGAFLYIVLCIDPSRVSLVFFGVAFEALKIVYV